MSANTSPDNITYPVTTDQVAPLETVFATMAASVQAALSARFGTTTGPAPALPVPSAAARNALYPVPVQGNRVWRTDTMQQEAYYGLYNITTNPGGRSPAGWYVVTEDTGWLAATLQNSWTNFGAPWATAAYRRIGQRVYLKGLVKNGAVSTMLTLPAGFRVAANDERIVPLQGVPIGGFGQVYVQASGAIVLQGYSGGASNGGLDLSGVSFEVA